MIEKKPNKNQRTILFCHGTGCVSGKGIEIRKALEKKVGELGLDNITVDFTGCHGFCQQGPIATVEPEGIFYTHVCLDDVDEIAESHLRDGKPVARLFYQDPVTNERVPYYRKINFYKKQQRITLRNCGKINPERIQDYIDAGGYEALRKVLTGMTPERVISEIKHSGLRGRGGAGFSTGTKWEFCRASPGNQKYMICNADEGDPGAFMDRSILEGDPHTVIEGMAIGAYAIGASEGYIYCRAEKPLAIERIATALKQAQERGFLGNNIFGSSFNFKVDLKKGAGAFVCGEETALMASIEGKRGMPRPRPPFPAQSGLWGKPTNINNVKTLATVPIIISNGSGWYAGIGTEKSKGTVVFALTGKIANAGLVEVPLGTPLSEIIYGIGGGIPDGKRFKAVQTGGPSGGCLPLSHLNLPVDYESLAGAGSIVGSGGMVVMDEDNCMVDMARFFLSFTQAESCGKCVMCRLGTKQMLSILDDIASGKARMEDIDTLLELCETVKAGSLCALGQTAPNPVLTTLRYFRSEYEEHIKKHHCSAAVCKGLVSAPCSHTCPAGVDVPRYVRFVARSKPGEALAVIREKIPFPSVCGLVCFHPCEAKCRRAQLDEEIGIRLLKRFAAECGDGLWRRQLKLAPATGKKVAIIGSGPAGLTAGYYLARLGHAVTVFEALPEPGGMMRYAIPDYRLPKNILAKEIKEIENAGLNIIVNTRVSSPKNLLKDGFDSVFLAIGAHQSMKLGIPGEDSPSVIGCLEFLKEINSGKREKPYDTVAVIGGGNAAIDSARTAIRLGAKNVTVLYRRTQGEMPASHDEVEAALAEGVKIEFLTAPLEITEKEGKLDLVCTRMKLGNIDSSGRRRPEPIEESQFSLTFDRIISAVGERPEIPPSFEIKPGPGNTLMVDPDTFMTGERGIFAGGDGVTGPASVIEAIATGREAAISIDKYLGGKGNIDEILAPPEGELEPLEEAEEKRRPLVPLLPVSRRLNNFEMVELGLPVDLAVEEARRCLRCDLEEEEAE